MHSVIFTSIRNIESKRNIEQNKFTNCNNLFHNPIIEKSEPFSFFFFFFCLHPRISNNFILSTPSKIFLFRYGNPTLSNLYHKCNKVA